MGRPVHKPRYDTDLMRPYWTALSKGHIKLPACAECAAWQWYPLDIPRCHPKAQLEWKEVPSTGTVFAATVVHRCLLPSDHRSEAPYTNALVELDGVKGPRLVVLLEEFADPEKAAGTKVKLKFAKADGLALPVFVPA